MRIEDALDDEPQVMEVHVINRNEFTIRDMFDGTEFEFPQDKAVSIPPDAALHIFGWFPDWTDEEGKLHTPSEAAMRAHITRRFGWNTPAFSGGTGDIFYSNIKIKPVKFRLVPVKEPEEEDVKPSVPAVTQKTRLMQAVDEA